MLTLSDSAEAKEVLHKYYEITRCSRLFKPTGLDGADVQTFSTVHWPTEVNTSASGASHCVTMLHQIACWMKPNEWSSEKDQVACGFAWTVVASDGHDLIFVTAMFFLAWWSSHDCGGAMLAGMCPFSIEDVVLRAAPCRNQLYSNPEGRQHQGWNRSNRFQ